MADLGRTEILWLCRADKDRLKPIDIEFMRKLHTKVNLIPVIAKADTLTDEEVTTFKQRVRAIPSSSSFLPAHRLGAELLRHQQGHAACRLNRRDMEPMCGPEALQHVTLII
jgi:hypothetical protein